MLKQEWEQGDWLGEAVVLMAALKGSRIGVQ